MRHNVGQSGKYGITTWSECTIGVVDGEEKQSK